MALKMSGYLDDFGLAVVLIVINGEQYPAAIDTGSAGNVIRLDMPGVIGLGSPNGTIKASNPMRGSLEAPAYTLKYKLEGLNSFEFNNSFMVMHTQHYHYPFLLGCEFILQLKSFTMYGQNKAFEIVV